MYVGEILHVEQEARNPEEDRFAVAIVKGETIVGHVPHKVLRLLWHSFIQHDGIVSCEVTGHRKHGIGLEVPCTYNFSAKKNIKQVDILISKTRRCKYYIYLKQCIYKTT